MKLNELKIKLRGMSANSPATKMMTAFEAATKKHPLSAKKRVLGSAFAELRVDGDNLIHISDIQSKVRGDGTKLMKLITDLADEYKVTLSLTAFGYEDTPTKALKKWYENLGFNALSGDDKDGYYMTRTSEGKAT